MKKIFITRHGQYDRLAGENDGSLNDEGRRTIEATANEISKYLHGRIIYDFTIFCSHKTRSIESASVIRNKFSIAPPIIECSNYVDDPKIDIDVHLGMVKSPICNPLGLSTGEVYMFFQQPAGFEPYEKVAFRFSRFLLNLIRRNDIEFAVIVTHAPTPDYLLFQHFNTGLCCGQDLKHGELLILEKSDFDFYFSFRGQVRKAYPSGLTFDVDYYLRKREQFELEIQTKRRQNVSHHQKIK